MRRDLVTSAIAIVVLTLLCGIAYPLLVTGVSQVAFPGNANGQKIYVHGKLMGSKIIGQSFEDQVVKNGKAQLTSTKGPLLTPNPRYFQTRPSATGEPYTAGGTPDNAAATAFSNLGPNSKATGQAIGGNVKAYISLNGRYYPGRLTAADVPVDAVNSSGSGIDPDISVANADIQAHRVAAVRHLSLRQVRQLIAKYTVGRGLGFSGEPGVDVLELNLALDRVTGSA